MTMMTKLGDVREEVRKLSENHWDESISTSDISFQSLDSVKIANEEHPIRLSAQRSFANRLGIPLQYLQKCSPELQAKNLNHWMERERNEKLFFRFQDQTIRAVFTPRYVPVDHVDVLNELGRYGFHDDLEVQSRLDDEMLLLNIPDKERAFELPGRDEMRPGFSIANSEVGVSSLNLSVFVLRLVCSNGMIAKDSMDARFRHVSNRGLDNLQQMLRDGHVGLEKHKRQWRISLDTPVDHPQDTFGAFNKRFNVNEAGRKAVEWGWLREQGPKMFHVVNSYTRGSQYPELTAESSFKLQKVGGSVLGLLN